MRTKSCKKRPCAMRKVLLTVCIAQGACLSSDTTKDDAAGEEKTRWYPGPFFFPDCFHPIVKMNSPFSSFWCNLIWHCSTFFQSGRSPARQDLCGGHQALVDWLDWLVYLFFSSYRVPRCRDPWHFFLCSSPYSVSISVQSKSIWRRSL